MGNGRKGVPIRVRKAAWLEARSEWTAAENSVSPNAPWRIFLDARYRVLTAFQALQRKARDDNDDDPDRGSSRDDEALDKAYRRLNLALDRLTVPFQYWSDHPHEDVLDSQGHDVLLVMLDDLESRFRRLAGLSPPASVDGDNCKESDTISSLTTMLHDGSVLRL
ncbi:hypothetical protein Rhopal_000733-T1 [Rhodotorula paludigena]|uniref:Uncharacterized protein n=1 Tax=Rhodotorula paludigena TaxID=86838 RepID=A0AAV5GCG9_9BASI|nr:hypothetical protein Rhopal_000733-T1 [Rhodotorula paludigena]